MSTLLQEYNASSNNSINENNCNMEKIRKSKLHKFKKVLKPFLSLLKKGKSVKKNTYRRSAAIEAPEIFYDSAYESDQNDANELLEARIKKEIDYCEDDAAIEIYVEGNMEVVPIIRGHHYIPVHFVKTPAGTFMWVGTSEPDSDFCCHDAYTEMQFPEEQVPIFADRWAQA